MAWLTTIVLLQPRDPLFVRAGETLSRMSRGKLIKGTPQELARSLLVEFREQQLEMAPLVA